MKAAGRRRPLGARIGRNPWIASLLIVAVFLAVSVAPAINIAMAMDQGANTMPPSSGMDHDMSGMEGPCCDDCESDGKSPCENLALCMSACGKLPVQLGVNIKISSPLKTYVPMLADSGNHDGRSQSPPRRPPKLV